MHRDARSSIESTASEVEGVMPPLSPINIPRLRPTPKVEVQFTPRDVEATPRVGPKSARAAILGRMKEQEQAKVAAEQRLQELGGGNAFSRTWSRMSRKSTRASVGDPAKGPAERTGGGSGGDSGAPTPLGTPRDPRVGVPKRREEAPKVGELHLNPTPRSQLTPRTAANKAAASVDPSAPQMPARTPRTAALDMSATMDLSYVSTRL
mmetsp:Transcript_54373/g.161553  ORF Transcript_54373/g.161553 Transcript_54373/m.161553 type:complete len:208 (-) Transcript_54373:249-872(-)